MGKDDGVCMCMMCRYAQFYKQISEDKPHLAVSSSSQGVTFRVEKDDLVIARILHGGMIDRQGLLHVGDIIKEVNGKDVGNNPTELQEMLKDCSGGITLKILPSYRDAPAPPQVHSHTQMQTNTLAYVMMGRCWTGLVNCPTALPTIPCAGM